MARAKRPSDERYNARRRAKRAAARAEKRGDYEEAFRLREQVKLSYVRNQIGKTVLQGASTQREAPYTRTQAQAQTATQKLKSSRPKRPSDELYNARRRLRRQAERIQREAQQQTGRARELAEGYAKYLMQQAQPTGKLDETQRKEALERLGRIREATKGITYEPFKVRRRNAIMMQQLNAAGTEGAESSISERKKDVFWAATKGLWPKGSQVARNDRYDLILSHFYTENTTDAKAFRDWLEQKKSTTAQDSFGDLQLVFEYLTEELNDPTIYELPELPYESVMDLIKTAM